MCQYHIGGNARTQDGEEGIWLLTFHGFIPQLQYSIAIGLAINDHDAFF